MYKRQSAQANTNRSLGYKKTASQAKTNGHKKEYAFVQAHGGEIIATGQKHIIMDAKGNQVEVKTKTDVRHPVYGNITVKAPAGGKVQMLLQVTEEVKKKWGDNHPIYLASQAQREFYEDRHFNNEKNAKLLYEKAKEQVVSLQIWLSSPSNFRKVLEYALMNDGEIDFVADMYRTLDNEAYLTPAKDFIDGIMAMNPKSYVTGSGLRIAVSIETGEFDKNGNKKTAAAFSFEVRSNANHCKSLLHKMEGGRIFPLIRKNVSSCKKLVGSC